MVGVDIVQIQRIQKFKDRFKEKGLKKFLNENEIKNAKKIETIAGYWAAKEAISKALKTGIGKKLRFLDIEIYKEKNGAPNFRLLNEKEKIFKIVDRSLSISHDGGFAIAVVIIFKEGDTLFKNCNI